MMIKPRLAEIVGTIPTIKEIVSHPFPADNPSIPKGANTWNLPYLPDAIDGRTMIARRFNDDIVGNHFHPCIPGKNPERFLLIMGSVVFWFDDLFGDHLEISLDADRLGPLEVHVPPYVLHGLEVVSSVAWFIEQQIGKFDPLICFSREEFVLLKDSLKE